MNYFAYGSNLHVKRLLERVPSARVVAVGRLGGFDLRFHKRGQDDSAKCNAFETGRPADVLHGVIYSIRTGERIGLDRAEGVGIGYEVRELTVTTAGGELRAFSYIAQPEFIDDSLRPFDWYRDLVLAGARAHGLPAAQISGIERIETVRDPDEGRRGRYIALLSE